MRRSAVLGILSTLVACGGTGPRIATEELGDVDLRVVVAKTSAAAEARVLLVDAPYRYELEPLDEVFGRGDALRVWVLGYTTEALVDAFPGLEGRGAADIADRLRPELAAAGAGRFAPPEPQVVLFTEVDESAPADVAYAPRPWSQAAPELGLSLALPGALACPPVGAVLRAFSRDDPSRVCIFTRAESCAWTRSDEQPCPNQARIFGADGPIIEQPDGSLRVGDRTCAPVEARATGEARGETAAFRCGDQVVGVQAQPLDAEGELVGPERGPSLSNPELTRPGQWVPASPGAYFAFEAGGEVELRRLGVDGNEADYLVLQHPVIDRPSQGARRASSADGQRITLSGGDFEINVGTAQAQCFRRVQGDRPIAWARIEAKDGARALTLAPPGMPAFTDALDWQVVGDPGQDFVFSPEVFAVRLPTDAGGLDTLSAQGPRFPTDLVVHARNRTFALTPITRFAGDERYFGCPVEVPRIADPVGPTIASPQGFYALEAGGVRLVDGAGQIGRLLSNGGEDTFSRSWTLTRTVTDRDLERVLVYREGVAHLFDPSGDIHDRHEVPGRIVAVLPGPELVYQPDETPYALRRARISAGQIASTTAYAVPAFEEASPVPPRIRAAAVHASSRAKLVGFSAGALVGVLDLDSGLSASVPVGAGADVVALFEDDGGAAVWAAVTTEAGSLELVRTPSL